MTILHRDFTFQTRSLDEAKRSVRVIASTDAVDAYGEIVLQDWDLTRYLKNPVVLWGHESREAPIGFASNVAVEEGKLAATLNFVDAKASPKAEEVWHGIQQGSLRAVSVGFQSRKAEQREVDGRTLFVLSGNELIEISVVPVPANPDAIIQRARSMRAIRELAGVHEALSRPASTPAGVDLAARVKELEARERALEAELATLRAPPVVESARERALVEQLREATEGRDRRDLITAGKQKSNVWPGIEAWARSLTVDQLRFYVEYVPGHPTLTRGVELEPEHSPATITWKGKAWDALSFDEKHDLYLQNNDLYRAMKAGAGDATP